MPFDGKIADYAKVTTTADELREAKALIPDQDHWFQGFMGRTLPARMGSADTSHCVVTAICRVSPCKPDKAVSVFARANGIEDTAVATACWNNADERVFADIPAAFDRAIALAESEG